MIEEVDHQREASQSALSNSDPSKRTREQEHDGEVDTASIGRDESLRDQILPSAVHNNSEAPEVLVNIESLEGGENHHHKEIGTDLGLPEKPAQETFPKSKV